MRQQIANLVNAATKPQSSPYQAEWISAAAYCLTNQRHLINEFWEQVGDVMIAMEETLDE